MAKNNIVIIIVIGAIILLGGMYLQKMYPIFSTQIRPANQANLPEAYTGEGSTYSSSSNGDDFGSSSDNCHPRWKCGTWSKCEDGMMYRDCEDSNDCGLEPTNPTERSCSLSGQAASSSSSSCSEGEEQCISTKTYKKCLASGKFSGTLTCPSGTTCLDGSCGTGESSSSCDADWSCDAWEDCTDGTQTRTCTDNNGCKEDKTQSQLCSDDPDANPDSSSGCVSNWKCGSWSSCIDSEQTQSCTDMNECRDDKEVTQTCDDSGKCIPFIQGYNRDVGTCDNDMTLIYLIVGVIGFIILISAIKG